MREPIDGIISAFHDAAFDDALWPAAAGRVDRAVGIAGNILTFGAGESDDDVVVYFNRLCYRGERYEEGERQYFEDYYAHDERIPRFRALPDARLAHVGDLFTDEEKRTSVVWNEALPIGRMRRCVTVLLDGPDRSRIFWTLGDPTGDGWSFGQTDLIARLLPHLRQYVRVRQALVDADALSGSLGALLENAHAGVLHLDRRGRIVGANDRALELVRRRDALLDRGGLLHLRAARDTDTLQGLLSRALPRFGGQGESGSMAVSRPGTLSRLVLHVVPVRPRDDDVVPSRVAAIVLVVDPDDEAPLDAALVGAALGLSPAESRAAVLLAEGRSVRDAARAIGCTDHAVRWHIRQIYDTHGMSRLTQLVQRVRAVGKLAPPRG